MSLPEIDVSLFFLINKGFKNGFLDIVMPFVTNNAELLFLPLIIGTVVKERSKAWPVMILSLLAVGVADGGGHVMKDLFARQRPCNTLGDINLLVGCGNSFSMPSNHASNASAVAGVFWLLRKDMSRYFFIFLAAAVGFSRVYVGVHYPFDVVAGAVVGACAAYLSVLLYGRASGIYERRAYGQAAYLIVLLFSLFRLYYILTTPFDLSPDEAHYWEWARRPDWAYYSKGPMIAWLIYAGTAVFGNNVFGVRVFAVLFSALSSLIIYRLAKGLYNEKAGLVSALLVQIVPLYSVYGVLLTIDSPFIFFWILSLYLFHKAENKSSGIQDNKNPAVGNTALIYWTLLGVSVGFGLLTKYTMAFFYICAFLYLIFSRARAKDSRKVALLHCCLAALISLLVFSPVIIWNAAHGWVTVRHTAGQAHISDGLRISARPFGEFLGSQFLVVTPILLALVFIAIWKTRKDKGGAFLFWFSVPVVLFFILKSIQGKVQANWALTGYATGFIAFSGYYIRDAFKKKVRVLCIAAILLAFTVTFFAHFPAALNLPPRKDPALRLVGWKELGREADRIYDELSLEGPVFILSDSYRVSGELAFYMKGNPVTYCINLGRRMNQYDLWPGFEGLTGYNAVFVRAGEKELPETLSGAFSRYETRALALKTKQNKIMKFTVFKCYDFKGIESKPAERY